MPVATRVDPARVKTLVDQRIDPIVAAYQLASGSEGLPKEGSALAPYAGQYQTERRSRTSWDELTLHIDGQATMVTHANQFGVSDSTGWGAYAVSADDSGTSTVHVRLIDDESLLATFLSSEPRLPGRLRSGKPSDDAGIVVVITDMTTEFDAAGVARKLTGTGPDKKPFTFTRTA
ncbi:hypothetical protein ACIOD2_46635 [Amycolatopsis sp. NPDC088138]|uniref:hypothetical protein n=1 Tax=Amycolatopsis sp. NPDC088138 TaxID=3363938 RepID=UPI003805C6FD